MEDRDMDGGQNNNYGYPQNDGYQQGQYQGQQMNNTYDNNGYVYNNQYQGQQMTGTEQQNMYQQGVKQKKVYNNPFDRVGSYNINMMVYLLIATMMFMSGSTTALTIFFVALFILEKDNELTKALVVMMLGAFALSLVSSIWYLIYSPVSNGLTSLMSSVGYYSDAYDIIEWIAKAFQFLNRTVNWVCDILFILFGALNLSALTKGKMKLPKFISKYFN